LKSGAGGVDFAEVDMNRESNDVLSKSESVAASCWSLKAAGFSWA
jgi:hypothetical protein